MNASQLSELPVKQLKEYLVLHGIDRQAYKEKSEIAELIHRTELLDIHEHTFRTWLPTAARVERTPNSFENFVNSLFSSSSPSASSPGMKRRQRAHTEPEQPPRRTGPCRTTEEGPERRSSRGSNRSQPSSPFTGRRSTRAPQTQQSTSSSSQPRPQQSTESHSSSSSSSRPAPQRPPQSQSRQEANLEDLLPAMLEQFIASAAAAAFSEANGGGSQESSHQHTRPRQSSTGQKPGSQTSNEPPAPSIASLVKDKVDISKLSIRTLKQILTENNVAVSGILERSELESRVQTLIQNVRLEALQANEELVCKICCDNPINCVLLECGHFVTCLECAKKIQETSNECPVCRFRIDRIVHTFRA